MSLDGTSNTFIPYTINGINPVAGSINTTNFVKYSGNTSNTDLGGFDLTTTGTLSAQQFAIPDNNSNDESWITYTVSTMGNPSTTGGLITTNTNGGSTMYFTGSVLGAPNFQFTTLGNAGKVVCTNGNSVMSTTINAGQLDYITALTSQAGGVGQNNTWTGTNDFTTLTSVAALRITSSVSNMDYSLSVNALDQLEIRNLTTGNALITGGDSLAVPVNVNVGGAVSAAETQITGSNYLYGFGSVEWRQHVPIGADDFEIWDEAGDRQLRLSRTTGLTISTMNITDVPSATPTLALGVNGSGGVVSFAVPVATNLLPLNNTWTGLNTFDLPVSVGNRLLGSTDTSPTGNFWIGLRGSGTETERLAIALLGDATTGAVDTITLNKKTNVLNTTTVSSKAFLTQSLRTAGMSSQAVQPAVITGGAPWLLTPSPASSPYAACYSPTQTWITGARYIFRFTDFTYAIFGMSVVFYQANVGDTGAVPISASFPFVPGDFTGIFTPNSNPGFLGQVYLQFQGTANKTFTWTSFTYEVGTFEVDGAIEMNGIANINGGSQFAVANNYMQTGSLTIGDPARNYGGGVAGWSSNTAGLLFECLDNTEIAVHDAGARVASMIYYSGGDNTMTLGRDMGFGSGASNVATASKLTVQDVIRFGNYSGGNYDNIQFMRGTGSGQYPNIRCQENYIAMYVSDAGGWVAGSQIGDMVIKPEAGRNLRLGVGGNAGLVVDSSNNVSLSGSLTMSITQRIYLYNISGVNNAGIVCEGSGDMVFFTGTSGTGTRLRIAAGGDITASNNLYANCLIVNGGGSFQPGCIYSDGNWGMLFRAKVVPASGIFGWYDANGSERMKMLTDASMTHTAGDSSYMRYGPNATWNANLVVGATPDRSGVGTAQVITTNGNLHLDAANGLDMYYGYYPDSRGTPNTHRFYGSSFFFASGLPQQNTTAIAPICFNGSQAFRSANINHVAYSNNSIAWGGGVYVSYAFYRTNAYVSTMIHGKLSYFVGGVGLAFPTIRIIHQATGQTWDYDLRAYFNVVSSHTTFPISIVFSSNNTLTTGWYDINVFNSGGCLTDANDQLWLLANTSMSNQFV